MIEAEQGKNQVLQAENEALRRDLEQTRGIQETNMQLNN